MRGTDFRKAQMSVGQKSLGAASGLDNQRSQKRIREARRQPEHGAVPPGLSQTVKKQQTHSLADSCLWAAGSECNQALDLLGSCCH